MNKKIIIFNWKMNPSSLKGAVSLFEQARTYTNRTRAGAEIIIAAPFIYLSKFSGLINKTKVKLGAQDVFYKDDGAFTGEISPKMLKNLGVEYVLIGHSERRKYLNETDEMINKKIKAALEAGLKVILCVGEEKRELGIKNYELGIRKAKNFVKKQLEKDLKGILNLKSYILNLIVAYEPIWAIGTGIPASPNDALEMIKFIKEILNSKFQILNSKVLYGGSVDSKNIAGFLKYKEIDGALVGGASLKKEEVKEIIKICGKSPK